MKAQTRRKLLDGAPYDALITPAQQRDRLIAKQAGVPDTLQLVARVATTYRGEVALLADTLRVGSPGRVDVGATCRALWEFVYGHVQYHLDEPGLEQVRHPARSWADRERGVDCEDYAVFLSALLQNMEVPHLLRISAYKGGWQHIYVVVPKTAAVAAPLPRTPYNEDYKKAQPDVPRLLRRDYFTLDCVTDQFDFEVATSKTMNLVMPQLLELSGVSDENDEIGALAGVDDTRDTLLVASYPSESGHTIGIGNLGGLFVRDAGDLGSIDGLGAIGAFKPWKSVRKAMLATPLKGPLKAKGAPARPVSTKIRRGGLYRKLVGTGGSFRNPAEVPGARNIAAAWLTDSRHYVGVDHLGGLYVMDDNGPEEIDRLAGLAGLAGLDLEDPQLAGWLKKGFKKVGNVTKAVAKPLAKAGKFVGKNAGKAVQAGFNVANKIPGVKYLADNYGMDILQTAGGLALTAATGGGAAPLLLAAKAAKGVSVATKVAKVAKVAKAAKTAAKAVSTAKKVSKAAAVVRKGQKVVAVAKKAQKAVKVAQKVSKMLPRKAVVPAAALPLAENDNPLSFMPANPDQIQDFAPRPLNLVQRMDEPEEEDAPSGPTIALSPETSGPLAFGSDAYVATSSVMEPYEDTPAAGEPATYAIEEPAYPAEELPYEMSQNDTYDQGLMVAPSDEMGALGALGLSTPGVLAAGGVVLALGIAAIWYGNQGASPRPTASAGLSGTPRRKSQKGRAKGRRGSVRTLKL